MLLERKGVDPVKVRELFHRFLAIGQEVRAARQIPPSEEILARHRSLLTQPNEIRTGYFSQKGDIPMKPDMAYRFIGESRLADLAAVGIVRNGYTAKGAPIKPEGDVVLWSADPRTTDENPTWIGFSSSLVWVEAPKEKVNADWVTIQDLAGIYVKNFDTGEVINLLAEKTEQ